jgi:GNAT superfamily N-acetyltransferase
MGGEYRIEYTDEPAWGEIGGGITEFNRQQVGASDERRLCYVLRAADGEVVGGVIGTTYWGWLQLDLIWVREDLRGLGHGHRLLEQAEEEALKRGATQVFLDTFSFQAPEFYSKHGYRVYGELADFPPGHTRYFMRKELWLPRRGGAPGRSIGSNARLANFCRHNRPDSPTCVF